MTFAQIRQNRFYFKGFWTTPPSKSFLRRDGLGETWGRESRSAYLTELFRGPLFIWGQISLRQVIDVEGAHSDGHVFSLFTEDMEFHHRVRFAGIFDLGVAKDGFADLNG